MIQHEGILPIFKPKNIPSFRLITILRKITGIRKIGHAGTLDPLAEGVMILLIGKQYTKKSHLFLNQDKEYLATLTLGCATTTFDAEGKQTHHSDKQPSVTEIDQIIAKYQGNMEQVPPMYSAKKIQGQKLYMLARKGIVVPRVANPITITTTKIDYTYPSLKLHIQCSKGTYIRSMAFDMGNDLGCFAYLSSLTRTKSGSFSLEDCITLEQLQAHTLPQYLCKSIPL